MKYDNLCPGTRIRVDTFTNSCLHGIVGTVLRKGILLGQLAYMVRFDNPVRYPGGRLCCEDLIFAHEICLVSKDVL